MKLRPLKLILILLALLLASTTLSAQAKYAISGNLYTGFILNTSDNLSVMPRNPSFGAEVDFEFLPQGNKPYQRWWNMPTIGIGVLGINLGNNKILGQAFAVYPYVLVPVVDLNVLKINFKMGLGLSANTRTWNMCDTLNGINSPDANASIGSIINGFMNLGANVSIPIREGFFFDLNFGFQHMSNGNIFQPNAGLNIIYLTLGATYRLNYCERCEKPKPPKEPFPYDFSIKLSVGGGTRELYYKDHKRYAIGSAHLGATYQIAPFYALGGGFDFFYDGAYVQQGTYSGMSAEQMAAQQQYTHYNRYLIENNDLKNKFRFGVSINNEFPIARVTIIFDWGIYLYDPIRSAYGPSVLKEYPSRGIFYRYNINKEDGWNYFRLGLRCRLYDNIYAQVAVKSHLQKAEFISFSLGYQLSFKKKQDYSSLTRKGASFELYHPDAKHKRGKPAFDNSQQQNQKEPKVKKHHRKPKI